MECHPGSKRGVSLTGSADSEMSEDQKKEKIAELKKKEKDIQDILAQKMKELKKVCLREAVKSQFFSSFESAAAAAFFLRFFSLPHPHLKG